MSHFQEVCEHGHIHSQCRCPGPKARISIKCPNPEEELAESLHQDRSFVNAWGGEINYGPADRLERKKAWQRSVGLY